MHADLQNATFTKILPEVNCSFSYRQYHGPSQSKSFATWHFHEEIELTYVNRGIGKRHIGRHLSKFYNGDLLLIGPNVPHNGFTNQFSRNSMETIIHFHPNFMGKDFFLLPETKHIQKLIERSNSGISFSGEIKVKVGRMMEQMNEMPYFDRISALLNILNILAITKDFILLNGHSPTILTNKKEVERLKIVYNYVEENFMNEVNLADVALMTGLSTPSFCRFFKKRSGRTFTRFVNEFRIIHATNLLTNKGLSITDICFESGFNNFSYFNRTFKEMVGKTPSKYRKEITVLLSQ